MKRTAFNGGEISPEMALRSDMDVYARSCSKLVNFDVSQMGGIARRRGMRQLARLADDESVLLPYTYSENDIFLVELHSELLIVRDREGKEVAQFTGGEYKWSYVSLDKVNSVQLNSLLLLLCPDAPVMQLRMDKYGEWTFERYEFKVPPWYTVDAREREVKVSPISGYEYRVTFDANELWDESTASNGDILRLSYFTEQQEAAGKRQSLCANVQVVSGITSSSSFKAGDKIAVRGELFTTYWVCVKRDEEKGPTEVIWQGSRDFVEGLTSPANYPDIFQEAEDLQGFDDITPIYRLTDELNYYYRSKIVLQSGYWEYYTCIRDFSASDFKASKTLPEQYPAHFIRGLAVGDALACKGAWSFYCSGSWNGSYEVRRCYDGKTLQDQWETRGESFSRVGSASNTQITGDEEEEECWLRLFLTRSRYLGDDDIAAGFPKDSCENRLIVSSYVHDMLTRCEVSGDDVRYVDESPIRVPLAGDMVTADWSWGAFSVRYGFPSVGLLHESRLIFASTAAQPQTLWFSAVDDLNNFDVGELDSSGMLLTMATNTQSGICWASSRGDIIMLGTEGAEWCIKGNDNAPLNSKNIRITNYGYNGSAHISAVLANDSVMYVERGAGRVYRYGYNYDSNSYVSTDMTVFAPHIAETHGGIVRGTELRKPDHKAVFVMGDGTLALMTVNTFHNVNAWHVYETQGRVVSACALPDGQNNDKLFLIVEREVSEDEEAGVVALTDDGTEGAEDTEGTEGTEDTEGTEGEGDGAEEGEGSAEDGEAEGAPPEAYSEDNIARFLEVIDANSPYEDGAGLDYTSTMETTAFSHPQYDDSKVLATSLQIFIAEPCPVEGVEVTMNGDDGSDYAPSDYPLVNFPRGWVSIAGKSKWTQHPIVGIRCSGNRGLHVLALQV